MGSVMSGASELDKNIGVSVRRLGYAGLLPQLAALALVMSGSEWQWIALASAYAYAALIFSFLGGVWWGQAIALGQPEPRALVVAVCPSLIGLALFIPWTLGWDWPGPALLYLGLLIALSPLVDRWLALGNHAWLLLRWQLSLALGFMTMLLGVWSMI